MSFRTTTTGSWSRPLPILERLPKSATGEVPESDSAPCLAAERETIREQLHPLGSREGPTEVSNGDILHRTSSVASSARWSAHRLG